MQWRKVCKLFRHFVGSDYFWFPPRMFRGSKAITIMWHTDAMSVPPSDGEFGIVKRHRKHSHCTRSDDIMKSAVTATFSKVFSVG